MLFVDDEQGVLDGLRVVLRRYRREWDMRFALGGDEAIRFIEEHPVDVVVTDLRMPGTDGIEVLRAAHRLRPEAARIVLSGYAEQEATVRAVPVAHQFLAKPCPPEQLREVVERATALQQLIASEELRRTFGRVEQLPTPSDTWRRLSSMLGDPNRSASDVARVIERDIALTSKVLQLVNSGFFGLGRRISSVAHAVAYLGFEAVRDLVLASDVFAPQQSGMSDEELVALQRRALLKARLVKLVRPEDPDAFTGGLLCEAGTLLLAVAFPERRDALRRAFREGRPRVEAERELLGVDHARAGAYLLGLWGLPYPIIEAVAHHHGPAELERDAPSLLDAVWIADALVDEILANSDPRCPLPPPAPLDTEHLARKGFDRQVAAWRSKVARWLEAAEEVA